MTIYVNGNPFELLRGMKVFHALIAAGFGDQITIITVFDEWGNELGHDGSLSEGQKLTAKITVKPR